MCLKQEWFFFGSFSSIFIFKLLPNTLSYGREIAEEKLDVIVHERKYFPLFLILVMIDAIFSLLLRIL